MERAFLFILTTLPGRMVLGAAIIAGMWIYKLYFA